MKNSLLWLMGLFFTVSFISSCEETDGVIDPYTDWEERNQHYIDSIASVAKANQGNAVGQWKIIHTYKYPQQGLVMGDVNEYVYCKVLEVGDGATPMFTDTVAANYCGKLIPLYNGSVVTFDQSYQGELNSDVATPSTFAVSGVITGWTTALQEMKEGDRWELYVPSDLGYGDYGKNEIPGFSTLIFDLDLVEVKKLKGNPKN
jgi:FKBP-type peptidyl-prolyl cis-trans isomerase FklB